jgi:hypothetical protein
VTGTGIYRYIPIVAILLGLAFSIIEASSFHFTALRSGLQYALYGIGNVAGTKYLKNIKGDDQIGNNLK